MGRIVMLAVLVFGLQSAFGGIKSERMLASILRQTPEAILVADGQQMKVADAMAEQMTDVQTFWGVGSSMEPLYAPKTAIIVKTIKYSELKKGMTVVYLNRRGPHGGALVDRRSSRRLDCPGDQQR